ncbi:PASTA domain-containing protein [Hoylesella saccharolytica]|uniref:PASTA domain-containing protein n=1 Tax=Hoylesella saccharolytica TaxID=633701 RepID=UPI0028E9D3A8|nr:PASTA domain-containing protein [Hoylesella saccharolytica]
MKSSDFFGKFKSSYLWGNILAMALVVLIIIIGIKYALDIYTRHGEAIPVPDIRHKSQADAERLLQDQGLAMMVTDTGYVKTLPANYILEQIPVAGEKVKSGHVVYVIINSGNTPTITLPDIIDNSSLREAIAKLKAMGFKVGPPKYITGEKDWVYGVAVRGKNVATGDKIPVDATVTVLAGNGERGADDAINYVDPVYPQDENTVEGEGDVDEFEEVTPQGNTPPATP